MKLWQTRSMSSFVKESFDRHARVGHRQSIRIMGRGLSRILASFSRLIFFIGIFCLSCVICYGDAESSSPVQDATGQMVRAEHSTLYAYHEPASSDERFGSEFKAFCWNLIGISFVALLTFGFCLYYRHNRRKEYRKNIILNHLPFRYFVVNNNGVVLSHNVGKLFKLITGQFSTLESLANRDIRQLMKEKTQDVIRTGIPEVVMYAFEENESRSATISRLPDDAYGFPVALWLSQDISELQKIRDEAKKNEEISRLMLESIGDGVIATDENGRCVKLNPVAESMLGVKTSDAVGRSHEEIIRTINLSDDSPYELPILRVLQTGLSVVDDELICLLSNDNSQQFYISYRLAPIHDDHGKIIGTILVLRDETEGYNRQKEIRAELANADAATGMAQIYNFRIKTKTLAVDGSRHLSDVWPFKDGTAVPSKDWVYPEDQPIWRKNYDDVRSGNKPHTIFQYRVLHDGVMRYFRCFFRGDSNRPDEITGLVQEVTELIRDRNRQDTMQELWSTCINSVPAMIFLKSVDNNYTYLQCNVKFAEFVGRTQEEVVGCTDYDLFAPPEQADHFLRVDREIIETGKTREFIESAPDANGEMRDIRTIKFSIRGSDGTRLLFGISVDITEDLKLQTEMQSLSTNWELASEIAQIVAYRINYKTWEITGNKQLPDFWPVRDGKAVQAKEWVYPPDVPLCEEQYEAVTSDRIPQAVFVYRVVKDDGMHYYRIFVHKISSSSDEVTGLIQDITSFVSAQKQKEAALTMWEKIINSIPALIYMKDAEDNFRYLQCNQNIAQFFGYTVDEMVGRSDEEIISTEYDRKMIRKNDTSVMKLGKPQTFYGNLTDNDGIVHRFESIKIPAKDVNGRNVLIGMTQEITELYELSEIRRIISSSFERLFSVENQREEVSEILKSVCEYVGFSRAFIDYIDESEGLIRLYTSYVPKGQRRVFDNKEFTLAEAQDLPWCRYLLNSKPGDVFEFDFMKEEGRRRAQEHLPGIWEKWEEFDIYGVRVSYIFVNGKPWGSLGFIAQHRPMKSFSKNDIHLLDMITHIIELAIFREQAILKLESTLRDLRAADKAKSFFLATMSHEIRTPLNAVLGFTDLLNNTLLDPVTQQEYITSISLAGHSLLQLINDILDLSKLESGQVVFVPEKTDMTEFCQEIAAIFSHSANEKNLKLVFETANMPFLYVDQQRLRQILFNLVGNAIKFTNFGGITVTMEVSNTSAHEGTLTVVVADTGIGIPPEDCERLFEPFVQLSRMRGTNSVSNGTGLGLPIVKKLISQMGGTISLASIPDKGSRFQFTIPNVKVEMCQPDQGDLPSIIRLCPSGEEPRILLVDDTPMNLKVLSSMLTRLQIKHEVAFSGQAALDTLEKGDFNIVMTDLIMPKMNGEQLARIIRANPDYESIRIAVVTAERNKAAYDHTLFDQIMEKPVSRDALFEYIYGK